MQKSKTQKNTEKQPPLTCHMVNGLTPQQVSTVGRRQRSGQEPGARLPVSESGLGPLVCHLWRSPVLQKSHGRIWALALLPPIFLMASTHSRQLHLQGEAGRKERWTWLWDIPRPPENIWMSHCQALPSSEKSWMSEVRKGGKVRKDCLTQEKNPLETPQADWHQSLKPPLRKNISLLNWYACRFINIQTCGHPWVRLSVYFSGF